MIHPIGDVPERNHGEAVLVLNVKRQSKKRTGKWKHSEILLALSF